MFTPTTTPLPTVHRQGGSRRRRWRLVALGVTLALVIAGALTCQSVIAPQMGCATATDASRTGAVTEYCLPGRFQAPNYGAMTVGSDGALWFVDAARGKITRVTSRGALTEFTPSAAPPAAPAPAIVSGPDGDLWYITSDAHGKLGRISASGASQAFALPQGSGAPSSLIVGPDHNLWASVMISEQSKIAKMSVTGEVSVMSLPSQMSVLGMVNGPDGNVWLITGGGNVWRLTPSGALIEFPTGANTPISGLAAGPDGNLWFIDYGGQLGRITPTGVVKLYQAATQVTVGGPTIGSGPDGNLWFAVEQGKMGRITPSGVVTQFTLPHGGDVTAITAGPDGGVWFLLQSTGFLTSYLQPTRLVRVTP